MSSHIPQLITAAVVVLAGFARAEVCDFENPDDPLCEGMGMMWQNMGGQPSLTNVNHTPGGSHGLYNNFNAPIGYSGPGIESLWIVSWAGFPAGTVEFVGITTVTLEPGVWQEVSLGGATSFEMRPNYNGTVGFGTFAIDDINYIPSPGGLMVLGAVLAFVRRSRRGLPV